MSDFLVTVGILACIFVGAAVVVTVFALLGRAIF